MGIYKKITIFEGGSGSDDKKAKVSADDTLSGFLEDKIVEGSSKVSVTTANPGGNETLEIDVNEANINHDALLNYEADEHAPLDDASTTSSSLWSSQKIQDELDTKINAALPMTDNKLVKSVGTSGIDVEATAITVDDLNNVTGINDLTIDGNLTVNGTTTSVNSTTLDVEDGNIVLNKNGTQASADTQDAGITIEMSDATDALIGYDSTLQSKFKAGEVGSAHEIVTTQHTQTLLNKTINVDDNTLSNIETDNFKAGVIQTDISGAVSDTNLASSQAIKTYINDQIATKDQASEISYSNISSGLVATNVQTAIDEVEGRLDTAESTLADHIDTDPGKHSAAQINNTPAGNLAATDVQAALNELQSDIDTRALASDLTNHINDAVDAHDASAISNVPSGNLVATDVQAALNELDSEKYIAANFNGDFDTRLATKSTTDIAEGTNLYFTNEKAQDAVGGILVDSSSVDLTYDDVNNTITAAVIPAGVSHDSLADFVSNEHVDHSTVEIQTAANSGLSGGGNITATRSLVVDINGTTAETSADNADEILIWDNSASARKKMTRANFLSGISLSSSGDLSETSFSGASGASSANVTGFAFANGSVRSFNAQVSVVVDADTDLYEEFEIRGIQKGASWEITVESRGDDTNVDFNINNSGQIIYSSPIYTGFVSMDVKFRAAVTGI
jgi:hypothetical protein